MKSDHRILNWDQGVNAIEQIADLSIRRVVRRAASLACNRVFQGHDSDISFDLYFLVSVLQELFQNKQIVIQELNGEECADWWDCDDIP